MIVTDKNRVKNAIRFVQEEANSLWLVLGKTTPWTSPYSDDNPPQATPTSVIISPVCAIKATPKWITEVTPTVGTYQFLDSNSVSRYFNEVSGSVDAIAQNVTNVLLFAQCLGSQLAGLGFTTYRQIGFTTNLVPAAGHTSDVFLIPANITSYGDLEAIENNVPDAVISQDTYVFENILQF